MSDKIVLTSRLFAFALAAFACSAPASAQPAACAQFFPGGQPPEVTNPKLAQRTTLLCNDAYAALASGVTRGALWSAERLTATSLAAARGIPRQGAFHPDGRLPRADRAQLDDYRRSGYDRGHMAPSGDMPDTRAQQQSFALSNMVPQTPELNRGPWERIERAVRRLAARQGELYVVTGPAFQGQQVQSIGPDGVLVPSSTWKAVHDPKAGGTGAYLCSNAAAPRCKTVSVAALARGVGIDPFPAVSERMKWTAMTLPRPERSSSARGHGRRRGRSPHDPTEQQERP